MSDCPDQIVATSSTGSLPAARTVNKNVQGCSKPRALTKLDGDNHDETAIRKQPQEGKPSLSRATGISESSTASVDREAIIEGNQFPLLEASLATRYTCASIVLAIFSVWGKHTFVLDGVPGGTTPLHSWKVPLMMNVFYLLSLPLLRIVSAKYLSKNVDVKSLLRESMLLYNIGQVLLNGWMVYAFVKAVLFNGHPLIGGSRDTVETGVTYAVWVHYCNKYLEYLDTYFMVLRGRMDQVSFLHVYHHTSISVAWWFGLKVYPGGDAYFGALFNSFIHVLMYSYYAMALLKIRCPWKKYLTQAQLLQFATVVLFSIASVTLCSATLEQYAAHFVQDFEMISLFVLFMVFYKKTYQTTKQSRGKHADKTNKINNRNPFDENKGRESAPSTESPDTNEEASVDTVISVSTDSSTE